MTRGHVVVDVVVDVDVGVGVDVGVDVGVGVGVGVGVSRTGLLPRLRRGVFRALKRAVLTA